MYLYQALTGVTLCLAAWLYLRWIKMKKYWANRGVPHQPPVPLFGNFTFLQRENIGHWLRRMYEHFKTPYIGIWVFWRPGLIVNSPEIARNILVKDSDNFRDRFLSSGDTDPIGGLNLLTIKDPLWSIVRRHLSGLFTGAKLRIFQDYTREKAKELVQRIHSTQNIKTNLKEMYIDYTTDVIGTSAFGVKSDATLTGEGPLRDVAKEFSRYSFYRSVAWCSIFFFPELVDIFRFKFFPKSSIIYFNKIFRSVMLQRETNPKPKDVKDLLDFLIDIQKDNEAFSEDMVIAQAAIILFGGFDTSGHVLSYATYQLAHNPEIQAIPTKRRQYSFFEHQNSDSENNVGRILTEFTKVDKLYQEISDALQRNGGEDFDMTILSELNYLNSVIKETLRMHTQMGWIDRKASKDYKVDDKLTIEAGTAVYINSYGMHFDPKYYPEPNKFNPDRFLPENKKNMEPFAYLPFGEGPRVCIGKRFGLMTVHFALAHVILNFKIQPYPNTPKPSDIKISTRTVWYTPAEPMHVKFISR